MGNNSKTVQAKADAKRKAYTGRSWTFLTYPENEPENWQAQLEDLKLPMFISPIHDRDLFKDRDRALGYSEQVDDETGIHYKKAHRHVLLRSSNAHFSYKKLQGLVDEINKQAVDGGGKPWIVLGPVNIAKISDFAAYARYLCHLDSADKTIYDPQKVVSLWGLDYSRYAVRDDTLDEVLRKVLDDLYLAEDVFTADDAERFVLRNYPYEATKLLKIYGRVIDNAGKGNYMRSLMNSSRYELKSHIPYKDKDGVISEGACVLDKATGRLIPLEDFREDQARRYVPLYQEDKQQDEDKPADTVRNEQDYDGADDDLAVDFLDFEDFDEWRKQSDERRAAKAESLKNSAEAGQDVERPSSGLAKALYEQCDEILDEIAADLGGDGDAENKDAAKDVLNGNGGDDEAAGLFDEDGDTGACSKPCSKS